MAVTSRRGSRQISHSSSAVRLKHRRQKPMVSLASTMAAARGSASCGERRSRWNVSRWAVFGPMPGSLLSSSMSRCMGGLYRMALGSLSPWGSGSAGSAAFSDA
jgi:hypothetical protein